MYSKIYFYSLLGLLVSLSCTTFLTAQDFVPLQQVDLPEIDNLEAQIVDKNSDGQLDILVRGITANGEVVTSVVARNGQIDTSGNQLFSNFQTGVDSNHLGIFTIADLDNDNEMDLLVSGIDENGAAKTAYYPGDLDYNFLPASPLPDFNASMMQVADLNNDGMKDIIVSGFDDLGALAFQIWQKEEDIFVPVPDLSFPGLINGSITIFDFDNNGFLDIFYSGEDLSGVISSQFLSNTGNFILEAISTGLPDMANGTAAVADYDADGDGDLLIHGQDASGQAFSQLYNNDSLNFTSENLNLTPITDGQLLFADLNQDGQVEIVVKGLNAGTLINHVYINQNGVFTADQNLLNVPEKLVQEFGDIYYDGNLDLVQLYRDAGDWKIEIFRNSGLLENLGPLPPANHFAINLGEEVKLFWDNFADDTTPDQSISSGIFIGPSRIQADQLSPNFRLDSLTRMLPSHGNQGFRRSLTLVDYPPSVYSYGIQGVDNSFHAIRNDGGGGGGGTGGNNGGIAYGEFVVCDQLNESTEIACTNSTIRLNSSSAGNDAGWYSENYGFLGFAPFIDYEVLEADIIYSSVSGSLDCADHLQISIEILIPEEFQYLEDTTVCEGSFVEFNYPLPFDYITWTFNSSSTVITQGSFAFEANEDTEVYLEVNQGNCAINDTMEITVDLVDLGVEETEITIAPGETAQLVAFGADTYSWEPAATLSAADIPNPIATPTENTLYTVTGFVESCMDTAAVNVIVTTQGFAPELFTPNGDGRNDRFRIFGENLSPAEFDFKIFDRSGNIVYRTDKFSSIGSAGWDGTHNNKPLPTGIYYWRVSGKTANGARILINESNAGSIQLVR